MFKRGQSGNPNGRPKLPDDIRDAVNANRDLVRRTIADLFSSDYGTLLGRIEGGNLNTLELALSNVLRAAIDFGDQKRLNFLLDRLIGKVENVIEFVPPQEPLNKIPAKMTFEEFCVNAGYPHPYEKQVEMKTFGINTEGARLILGARGYGKTDYVVILGIAYEIYLDPMGYTSLIITKDSERNSAMLKEIHDACEKAGVAFEIDNAKALRVSGLLGKDHSVSAATINSVRLRGRHPKLIVLDDPVTPDDDSESVRRKAKRVYDECHKLKKNILLIGQPVHKFDLYNDVRNLISCLEVPHGSIPELDADLEAQRIAGVSEASIQASYHLTVLSEGTVAFDKIHRMDTYPQGDSIAFIDPAFGGADYTAIAIMRGHFQGVAVVGFAWKKSWEHCLDDMAAAIKKYGVMKLAFETNKTGDQPLNILRQAFGVGVSGIFSNTNKHSRIMAAGAYAHMLHLSKESNKDFVDQTLRYEYNAKNDDAPDAIASGLAWIGLIRGKDNG